MMAIGTRHLSDREVMEALMPGSVNDNEEDWSWPEQDRAISIKGLTPGVAFDLAECCHPVPGDRIVPSFSVPTLCPPFRDSHL